MMFNRVNLIYFTVIFVQLRPTVGGASEGTLQVKFKAFLESIPTNQEVGLCKDEKRVNFDTIFVVGAIERALSSLLIPELGDDQQLTAGEVSEAVLKPYIFL